MRGVGSSAAIIRGQLVILSQLLLLEGGYYKRGRHLIAEIRYAFVTLYPVLNGSLINWLITLYIDTIGHVSILAIGFVSRKFQIPMYFPP